MLQLHPGGESAKRARLERRGYIIERISFNELTYDFTSRDDNASLALFDVRAEKAEMWIDQSPIDTSLDLRDRIIVMPQGRQFQGHVEMVPRSNSVLLLSIEPDFLPERLGEKLEKADPGVCFPDPNLAGTLKKIDRLLCGEIIDKALLDALALVAAIEAVGSLDTLLDIKPGSLTRAHANQTLQFIDANLSRQIHLSEMARVVDLSEFHFSRGFKQTFGTSPYRFLLTRRIERAKQLMRTDDLSLNEIAAQCGFNSASRFSHVFRKIVGETPRQYRGRIGGDGGAS